MAEIIFNKAVSKDFFLMKTASENNARAGQFYMLRAWDTYPVLSRPVSVFDADGESVTFLYRVVGEGTRIFSGLKAGGGIQLQGPYGNGFPDVTGKIALVGGGAGIAPLHLAAKRLHMADAASADTAGADAANRVDMFLGFSGEPMLTEEFAAVSDSLTIDVGGYITDKIEPRDYDCVLTCGPEAMMRALYKKCGDTPLYVSMEKRMACGIGSCLVCSCKTAGGNRRVCKDGPVFKAKEVFGV